MARSPLAVLVPLAGGLGLIALYDPGFFALFLPYMPGALLVALWGSIVVFVARHVAADRVRSESVRALAIVAGSATLGGTYFAYLSAAPFPPDAVRVVPLLWLAGALAGWIFVVRALRLDPRRLAAVVGMILNVPNTMLAAIFSLAALMGDSRTDRAWTVRMSAERVDMTIAGVGDGLAAGWHSP